MKKRIYLLLALLLLLIAAVGCARNTALRTFRADNEILTYTRIDPDKTQLVVSRTGNIEVRRFCRAFEEQNPDVQVVYLDLTGGNGNCKPVVDWVKNGCLPDVMITAAGFFTDEETAQYFEDLSAEPLIANYEADALKRASVNASIYRLPGPSSINAMMYNKTLFQQYGWEVPATFDEFIALCRRIREDTDGQVEPWNPNAKYDNELLTAVEAFTYEELFGGADNRAWYTAFISGEGGAAFRGHMEPYYEVLRQLAEEGLLRPEHFSYSATTRGKEFAAGQIAMVNMNISDYDNDAFDFSYMPFPTTQGELGYLCDAFSCFVSVPKKEHSDREREVITRFLEFFSSPEGQRIFIGEGMQVSNVKGAVLNQSDDLADLQPAVEAGHMFERMEFEGALGKANFSLWQHAKRLTEGTATVEDCIAKVDAAPYRPAGSEEAAVQEVLATAPASLTMLETSFYIADAYRAAAEADIGLITHGEAYRGNLMRIFAGDLTPAFVEAFKPRSFENGAVLEKLVMTGGQLLEALNHPVGNERTADCVYAYSGLRCELAPWRPLGEKYLSVKLADGSPLDPDRLYTVAAWSGTVDPQYVTRVEQRYEDSWQALMTARLQADGTVKAASDGRVKLEWK